MSKSIDGGIGNGWRAPCAFARSGGDRVVCITPVPEYFLSYFTTMRGAHAFRMAQYVGHNRDESEYFFEF